MNRQRVQDPRRRQERDDRDDRGWLGPGDELADEQNWRGQYGGYGEPDRPPRGRGADTRSASWRGEPGDRDADDRGRNDPDWSRYASETGPDWRRMGAEA